MSFRRLSLLLPGGRWGHHQVLLFHRVLERPDPLMPDEPHLELFDRLIARLSRDFNILPLADAIERAKLGTLPSASLSITFDDGYADNFTLALPVLEKYRATATFFVATGFLDGGRMWNDTLIETARRLPDGEIRYPFAEAETVNIGSDEDRRKLALRAISFCKYLPLDERNRRVDSFAGLQNQPLPDTLMMSSEQLRKMAASNSADIGAHTHSHPILAKCHDALAEHEIRRSVEDLTRLLGEAPRLFAYPNGKLGVDYHAHQTRLVAEAGLEAAVATDWGVLTRDTDPYQIPRFTPWARNLNRFVLDLVRARYGLL
jgi:peptidoglycan/xylan/chitin deacetylase (PgdA/CDA1 family)